MLAIKMKKSLFMLIVGISINCTNNRPSRITIVDIGQKNRIELGKQIRLINSYSPKLITLDFFLVPDSLDVDSILVKELEKIDNVIQIAGLHDLYGSEDIWDSLKVSHPKFKRSHIGFANLTGNDSVIVNELPMSQRIDGKQIHSFSYVIAENSYGVKSKFKDKGEEPLKLSFSGIGKNYKIISNNDLTSGKFKREDFFDKIVIFGYIGGKEDWLYLDKKKRKKINGVEIHAAITDELLDL